MSLLTAALIGLFVFSSWFVIWCIVRSGDDGDDT